MAFRMLKMNELPFELVTEILARVPVKDLLRFRSVCKAWCSLFQDERFIRKHKTYAPSMILLLHGRPHDTYPPPRTCTYQGRKLEMIFEEPDLNADGEKNLLLKASVIGHCDGLFCLELQGMSLAIWNPALRQVRKVARIKDRLTRGLIGFGYDHSIQDHKILVFPPLLTSTEPLKNSSKAQVLTLKSGVSRMIDFPWTENCHWPRVKQEGILVGESIFWQLYARSSDIELRENILTFSLVSETFSYCFSPSPECGELVYRVLMALRGSLCAVERERGEYCDDMVVWCAEHEKDDNGRIKSWSKILRLTASDIERSTCWRVYEFRLGTVINQAGLLLVKVTTRGGEIKLCEYNLKEGRLRKVEAGLNLSYFGIMEEYIATLVLARAY